MSKWPTDYICQGLKLKPPEPVISNQCTNGLSVGRIDLSSLSGIRPQVTSGDIINLFLWGLKKWFFAFFYFFFKGRRLCPPHSQLDLPWS